MRRYYNERAGQQGEPPKWTLSEAAFQIYESFVFFQEKGWFQRAFGYWCVDSAHATPGLKGTDLSKHFLRMTTIRIEARFHDFIKKTNEVSLFSVF